MARIETWALDEDDQHCPETWGVDPDYAFESSHWED